MSDWWLGQLARQDQYGEPPPADWPVPQMPEQPEDRDPFEAAARTVRAPYRNLPAPGSNRIGQLAEQVTSMPSWADVATQQMNKDKEAFQTGGIGSLLADTSVAQELAGGFGGTTKAVGKPVIGELASPFYSAAGRAVENAKLGKGTGEQWLGYLRNQPGVKPEELQYVFGNLPEGQLTKAQMQAHAAENAVTLGEVTRGAPQYSQEMQKFLTQQENSNIAPRPAPTTPDQWQALSERLMWMGQNRQPLGDTAGAQRFFSLSEEAGRRAEGVNASTGSTAGMPKYSQWQLPGGENYRETLLTLPKSEMLGEVKDALETYKLLARDQADLMAEWKGLAEANPPGHPDTLAAYQRVAAARMKTDAAREEATRLSDQYKASEFKSSHWDEPNVLAHVRTNDREIPGVGKSLHVEEIQSDWHQKGRAGGYNNAERAAEIDGIKQQLTKLTDEWDTLGATSPRRGTISEEMNVLNDKLRSMNSDSPGVPDAPFKSTWADVALKRQIREAAEKGYDAISWTPGKAQAARYPDALRQAVSNISWSSPGAGGRANPDGLRYVHAKPNGGGTDLVFTINKDGAITEASTAAAKGKHVEDIFGKDMAKQIMGEAEGDIASKDFVIGAKGMEGFYDKMLVDKANAIAKKHGARVEQAEIDTKPERGPVPEGSHDFSRNAPVHVLRITPELRAAAMKGFPLFTAGGVVAGGAIGELARQDKYGRNE